jgi:hypothetical protein
MSRVIKNIARCTVVGFLLLAISGLTIAIHHEHPIVGMLSEHGHEQHDGLVVKNTPPTYHEIHFLKLLSGDSFNGTQKIELKSSLTKLFAVHIEVLELHPIGYSTFLLNTDISGTGPPSVDRCVLNCSFLI